MALSVKKRALSMRTKRESGSHGMKIVR